MVEIFFEQENVFGNVKNDWLKMRKNKNKKNKNLTSIWKINFLYENEKSLIELLIGLNIWTEIADC